MALRDRDLTPDEERRQALLEAKLRAIVRERTGADAVEAIGFGAGAGVVAGGEAWVLGEGRAERRLGAALAWARSRRVASLHVVADEHDDGAGVLARRAAAFARAPSVWRTVGRELVAVEPSPFPPDRPLDARVAPFADLLAAAGADLVVEHGVLLGEVLGLEVARVVTRDGGPVLEIGVGRFDREATAELYGDVPDAEALAGVVEVVRSHRRPGAPPHPLNRISQERWLRTRLLAEPGLVGADHLAPVQTPVPRPNLLEPSPAAAVGADASGAPVVAVCSTGIDLDLVPTAADVRRASTGSDEARLVLVVPERDAHPVTRALAGMLAAPAEVVILPGDWRAGPGGAVAGPH